MDLKKDYFKVGRRFSSFKEIKKLVQQYTHETNVEWSIRDAQTIKAAINCNVKKAKAARNKALKYFTLKLGCIYGRRFKPMGRNLRRRKTTKTECKAYVRFALTFMGKHLEILDVNLDHNHEIKPRALTKIGFRAELRRKRLMETLKIPYQDAYRIEREEYFRDHPEMMFYKENCTSLYQSTSEESEDAEADSEHNIKCENNIESGNSIRSEIVDKNENSFNVDYNDVLFINSNHSVDNSDQIYSRSGDSGITFTFNGIVKSKDDDIIEALGTIEELSSAIGISIEFLPESCGSITLQLRTIQCVLQDLFVHLGTPPENEAVIQEANFEFPENHVLNLEKWIDEYMENLPQTENIVLPSGGRGSCHLHLARAVCRRAERRTVSLLKDYEVSKIAVKYLNRLGDYLFVVARSVSSFAGFKEEYYKPPEIKPQEYKVIYLPQRPS